MERFVRPTPVLNVTEPDCPDEGTEIDFINYDTNRDLAEVVLSTGGDASDVLHNSGNQLVLPNTLA